jgi:hypothetical protein
MLKRRTILKKSPSTLKRNSTLKRKPKTVEQLQEQSVQHERDWIFYNEIWNERGPYSEISGTYLGSEVNKACCDHLLEKAQYPHLRYVKENLILVTIDEHCMKTNGHPLPKHKERIEQAKKLLLNNEL